ncbi:cytochrome P450 [Trametes meyenii]|nr:cytochrome P450 [Trametes meyenii]
MPSATLITSDSGFRYACIAAGLSFIIIKFIASYNWILGDMKVLAKGFDRVAVQEHWDSAYGLVFKYKGYFNADRIHTTDVRALNCFLTHSEDFSKWDQSCRNLARALGNSLLVINGVDHRRQATAYESIILHDNGLNQMTLDVIGMARFSYDIDALGIHGSRSELNRAFQRPTGSTAGRGFPFIVIAKTYFPILKFIPDQMSNRSLWAQAIMRRVGMQLLAEKKAKLLSDGGAKGSVERKDVVGRDLLTLLIKANMAADVPDNQRLTDEEVLSQIPTFFIAGHDTTSTATTWCLFALAQHPSIEDKLHEELE